ncbi:MAG: transcription termination/antitermination protein NusG [Dehalococcoidia bacterium]
MTGWYIAKSKPQKETWLSHSLENLGVEVSYPRIMTQRRGKRVLEPLFHTYLFCRLDINTPNWPAIRWAPGLNYFLGIDGHPSRLPDELVSYVQQRVKWWNDRGFGARRLKLGERVEVASGPFAGLEGVFQRYVSARQRCRILLQVVGRLSPVELEETDLTMALPRL